MMKKNILKIISLFVFVLLFPYITYAKTNNIKPKTVAPAPLEISAWIPYWRQAAGATDILPHLSLFKQISPFGFTVKSDGTLYDPMHIDTEPWQTLIATAHGQKVKVIPSIMWSDGDAIDKILRNPKLRKAHVAEITKMLNTYNFDGVDIDYEGKKDVTKNYFSLFLRDLYNATGKKLVVCSIEPRTPLDSRFETIPTNITYANDFVAINKYCDQVRIMAYDQGTIDLKLNDSAQGVYNPIADTQWVEKVVALVSKTISKKKIVIGVATYGHEFEVTPVSGGYEYHFLGSFDQNYALAIAPQFNTTPTRNQAGELSFTYMPTSTIVTLPSGNNTPTNTVAIATTSIASSTIPTSISSQPFRLLWWSDSVAIHDKILLAKKLGVRGISIFKIDGGEDPAIWNILK